MKTKIYLLSLVFFLGIQYNAKSQGVSINEDGSDPHSSAMLDIQSTTSGLLVPRMNFAEMYSISSPAEGLIVYSTTNHFFYYYNGSIWEKIIAGEDDDWTIDGDNMYSNNTGLIGIGATTTLPTHKLTIENNTSSNVLRLIGPNNFGSGSKINFGDGEYTYISEYMDDHLMVYGSGGLRLYSNNNISAISNNGNLLFSAPSGGVGINDNLAPPDASAILDVTSTEKGVLIPRMSTEQIQAIPNPGDGLQAYSTTNGSLYIFVESAGVWKQVSYSSGIIAPPFETCGDLLTDSRDNQIYNTIEINGQCWMAENLNYGNQISSNSYQNNNGVVEKYCYNNSTTYCDNLGGLYQWNEMMDYTTTEGAQGICMDGWHVPTDIEWMAMETYLDPTVPNYNQIGWRGQTVGNKLKNTGSGSYNWNGGNQGTNESGFTARAGGVRNSNSYFTAYGTNGLFWTSTTSGSNAYHRQMYYYYSTVYRSAIYKTSGISVRCVKD